MSGRIPFPSQHRHSWHTVYGILVGIEVISGKVYVSQSHAFNRNAINIVDERKFVMLSGDLTLQSQFNGNGKI